MWQFIKEAWLICVERAKTRKALRMLSKQQWSVEFLTAMLIRAANTMNTPLEMTIVNGSSSFIIRTSETQNISTYRDDSIFNHLDDEVRVKQFMDQLRARG